jgi:hypothetical protein
MGYTDGMYNGLDPYSFNCFDACLLTQACFPLLVWSRFLSRAGSAKLYTYITIKLFTNGNNLTIIRIMLY